MASLYTYWKDHPDEEAYIGKTYASSAPLKILLTPLEWIGLTSFTDSIYQAQYKKVLPSLNVHYIQTELNVKWDDSAWGEMFRSGQIPVDRAVFEVREVMDHFRALKARHELKQDERVKPLLTENDEGADLKALASKWIAFKALREKTDKNISFDRLSLIVKGDKGFLDLDLEKLSTYIDWLNQGILPPDADLAKLKLLTDRQQVALAYPWIQTYIPRDLWFELKGSEPLSPAGAQAILELEQVIDWHEAGILNFSDPIHWERRESLVSLFKSYRREDLTLFAPRLFAHPFWQLEKPPLEILQPADGLSPDTLLSQPEVQKHVRAKQLSDYQFRLQSLGGKHFSQLIFDALSPLTRSLEQDIENDPHYATVRKAEQKITDWRNALSLEPHEEPLFEKFLQTSLKSLPLPDHLLETLFERRLGSEYLVMRTCYHRNHRPPLPLSLEGRLMILLPFSRNLKEVKTLFTQFCHKRAYTFVEKDQSYVYTEELHAFISDLIELIKPKVTPLSLDQMQQTERLILHSLALLLSGQIEGGPLIRLFKTLDLSIEQLSQTKAEAFFAAFLIREKEIREKKCFLEMGEKPLKRFLWLSAVKAGRVLAEELIVSPEEARSENFKKPFKVLEKRYESQEGFHQNYFFFKRFLPTHVFFLGLTYLHNGTLEALLTLQLDEAIQTLQTMLKAIRDDLREKSVEEVIKAYEDNPFSHFPEGFIFPFSRYLIDEINSAKAYEASVGEPPPLGIHILQNINILIQILTAIEAVKLTRGLGNSIISIITPLVLQLTLPFCDKKESKALTELVGLAIPHLLHKHDFKPLSAYLKKVEALMKSKQKLTLEEEKLLLRETTHILDWLILQLRPYRQNVSAFIQSLKRAFPA